MFSNSDWFWGVIFPMVVIGVLIGFGLFVVLPWLWPYVKYAILLAVQ